GPRDDRPRRRRQLGPRLPDGVRGRAGPGRDRLLLQQPRRPRAGERRRPPHRTQHLHPVARTPAPVPATTTTMRKAEVSMRRRTRTATVLAALTAGALALGGCSGSAGDEERIWVGVVGGDPMNFGLNAQLAVGSAPRLFSAQILDPLIYMSDDFELSP